MNTEDQDLEQLSEEQIGFSAITEGLGFHQKKPAKSGPIPESEIGTGAILAGEVKFAQKPLTRMNRSNLSGKESTTQEIQSANQHSLDVFLPAPEQTANPLPNATSHVSSTLAPAQPETNRLQYFVRRIAAFVFDLALLFLPAFLILEVFIGSSEAFRTFAQMPVLTLLATFIYISTYFLLTETISGQSVGKILAGLRVVEDDKYQKKISLESNIIRNLAFPMVVVPFFIGLIISLKDSKFRGWHDKLSRSKVAFFAVTD